MTKTIALVFVLLLTVPAHAQRRRASPPPPKRSTESTGNRLVLLTGQCRFQILREAFQPCNANVMFAQLANGRSVLTFARNKPKTAMFTLSGGPDRQPNLENYSLGIDTLRIKTGDDDELVDTHMEGECHFHMNKTATKFFFIKCDVYDRAVETVYAFYIENIRKTDHRAS